jgi:hypothetical protein
MRKSLLDKTKIFSSQSDMVGWTKQSRVIYLSFSVWFGWFIVFNARFNNISVISWWSVLLVEETNGSQRLQVYKQ